MSVKERLQAVLNGFGYRSWLMHTMPAKQKYPDSFFTYLSIDTPFASYYDNAPHSAVWAFWIGFYSSDPDLVENVPRELARRLRAAGWTVPGLGEDVQSEEPSHTGRRITAYYTERFEEE